MIVNLDDMKQALRKTQEGFQFAFFLTVPLFMVVMEIGFIDLLDVMGLTAIWSTFIMAPWIVTTLLNMGIEIYLFLEAEREELDHELITEEIDND